MLQQISTSLRVTVVTLVLTGLLYPLAVTVVARIAFPSRAGGSIVVDGSGGPVGSELLAQGFSSPAYFQPRPSAAGERGMWFTKARAASICIKPWAMPGARI